MTLPSRLTVFVVVVLTVLASTTPAVAIGGADSAASVERAPAVSEPATDPALMANNDTRANETANETANESVNETANETAKNTQNESVNVSLGIQLSTILQATSADVRTTIENTAFEVTFETANESVRAELIEARGDELLERAETIEEDYEQATEAYRAGTLNDTQYAQRIATLNARAENLLASVESLQKRARNVSALALRAAGVNRTALQSAIADLDAVTGVSPSALLNRFIGTFDGSVALEATRGLSIEVEAEDGERSREFTFQSDTNQTINVTQGTALETARSAITNVSGDWVLTRSSIDTRRGTYHFEFSLRSNSSTGDAEVTIDGSTGAVISLEESIEPLDVGEQGDDEADDHAAGPGEDRDDSEDQEDDSEDQEDESENEDELEDREANESDGQGDAEMDESGDEEDRVGPSELSLLVVDGIPKPNETVTVRVVAEGQPVENATVHLEDTVLGRTGPNGTFTLTLPAGETKLRAEKGDREAELSFEFESEDEDDRAFFRAFQVSGQLENGNATLSVTYNGSGVANATVFANDRRIGTTDDDGTVTFGLENGTEDLDIEVVKGAFEAELSYQVQNGSLVQVEGAHEGDGDKTKTEGRDEDSDDDDSEQSDDDSDETEDDSSSAEDDDSSSDDSSSAEDDDSSSDDSSSAEDDDSSSDDSSSSGDDDSSSDDSSSSGDDDSSSDGSSDDGTSGEGTEDGTDDGTDSSGDTSDTDGDTEEDSTDDEDTSDDSGEDSGTTSD